MVPPVDKLTTKRTTAKIQTLTTTIVTPYSSKVLLKATRTYPHMPVHFFGEEATMLNGNQAAIVARTVSPLTLQVIGVVGVGMVLSIALCCSRYYMKQHLRKYQIKGDLHERQPSWTRERMLQTDGAVSWDRKNIGNHVTLMSLRCIFVNLVSQFAMSARPDARGQQLADDDGLTTIYEGAMSNTGFSSGRHVYAFMWPRDQCFVEDAYLAFGIGYPDTDLQGCEEVILGGNRKSMAFNIITNELYFNSAKVASYPPRKSKDFFIPTLFYMYMDLDDGKLSFGSESEYWGTAFNFGSMRRNHSKPLHVFVSFRAMKGKIMMFYKGRVEEQKVILSDNDSDDSGIVCQNEACEKMTKKRSAACQTSLDASHQGASFHMHPLAYCNASFIHEEAGVETQMSGTDAAEMALQQLASHEGLQGGKCKETDLNDISVIMTCDDTSYGYKNVDLIPEDSHYI